MIGATTAHDDRLTPDGRRVRPSSYAVPRDPGTFFRLLYGDGAPGHLVLWTLQGKETTWWPARDPDGAAAEVARLAATKDAYYGIGLQDRDAALRHAEAEERRLAEAERRRPRIVAPEHIRGYHETTLALPGAHVDIDILDPVHKKDRLPPTVGDALALLTEFRPRPTLTLESGHGLQAYWLFRELWTLEDADEREAARSLVRRLQATLRARATLRGWDLDSTHDLTRLLRPDGTWNRKREPVPVRVLELDERQRYNPDDLEPYLLDVEAGPRPDAPPVPLPADLPSVDIATLRIPPWTRRLIKEGRDADPEFYSSRSEAAWSAMQDLIRAGCDDATLAAVLLDPDNLIGQKAREQGRRWLAGDIARARREVDAAPRFRFARRAVRRPTLSCEVPVCHS